MIRFALVGQEFLNNIIKYTRTVSVIIPEEEGHTIKWATNICTMGGKLSQIIIKLHQLNVDVKAIEVTKEGPYFVINFEESSTVTSFTNLNER